MLTTLYDVLKSDMNNNSKIHMIKEIDSVLSLNLLQEELNLIPDEIKEKIEKMIENRNKAKKEKNFEEADKIRNELLKMNVEIKDTRESTKSAYWIYIPSKSKT